MNPGSLILSGIFLWDTAFYLNVLYKLKNTTCLIVHSQCAWTGIKENTNSLLTCSSNVLSRTTSNSLQHLVHGSIVFLDTLTLDHGFHNTVLPMVFNQPSLSTSWIPTPWFSPWNSSPCVFPPKDLIIPVPSTSFMQINFIFTFSSNLLLELQVHNPHVAVLCIYTLHYNSLCGRNNYISRFLFVKLPEAYSEYPGLWEINLSHYCHFLLHEDKAQSQIIWKPFQSSLIRLLNAIWMRDAFWMPPVSDQRFHQVELHYCFQSTYTWGRIIFSKSRYPLPQSRSYFLRQILSSTPKCWQIAALDLQLSARSINLQLLPSVRNKIIYLLFLTSKTLNPSICSFSGTVSITSSINLGFVQ